jgi:hypothetical protein
LNEGRGAIPASKKPFAGMRPSGLGRMQIVPPVIMMSTRESVTPLLSPVAPVGAFDSMLLCVYGLVLKSFRVGRVRMGFEMGKVVDITARDLRDRKAFRGRAAVYFLNIYSSPGALALE